MYVACASHSFNMSSFSSALAIDGLVTLQTDKAISTSWRVNGLLFLRSFNIGSKIVGLNRFISSGIFDNSFIALIITDEAGLSNSVSLPVIIFPFGNSSAMILDFFFLKFF